LYNISFANFVFGGGGARPSRPPLNLSLVIVVTVIVVSIVLKQLKQPGECI
jgi:hypothetical protein